MPTFDHIIAFINVLPVIEQNNLISIIYFHVDCSLFMYNVYVWPTYYNYVWGFQTENFRLDNGQKD